MICHFSSHMSGKSKPTNNNETHVKSSAKKNPGALKTSTPKGPPKPGTASGTKSTQSHAKPSSSHPNSSSSPKPKHSRSKNSSTNMSAQAKVSAQKKKLWQKEQRKLMKELNSTKAQQSNDIQELNSSDEFTFSLTSRNPLGRLTNKRKPITKINISRKNTITLSPPHQERIISILRSFPWDHTIRYVGSPEGTLEQNLGELVHIGFRLHHALQSLKYSNNNYDLALEWLVVHLDNQHLPLGIRSDRANAKVELVSFDAESRRTKEITRRIESFGFLKSQITIQLEQAKNDELQALYTLLESHLPRQAVSTMKQVRQDLNGNPADNEDIRMQREDEICSLSIILGDDGEFQQVNDSLLKIKFKLPPQCFIAFTADPNTSNLDPNQDYSFYLEVHIPADNCYPMELPLLGLTCAALKGEVLYAFTKRLVAEAFNYIGQPVIYPLVTWIQSQSPRQLPKLIEFFNDSNNCREAHELYSKTLKEEEMDRMALKQIKSEFKISSNNTSQHSGYGAVDDAQEDGDNIDEDGEVEYEDLEFLTQDELSALERANSWSYETDGTTSSNSSSSSASSSHGRNQLESSLNSFESLPPSIQKQISYLSSSDYQSKLKLKSEELSKRVKGMRDTNEKYKKMLKTRQSLPAFQQRQQILQSINQHDSNVVLISGATGCGKTTQVAQLILDDLIDSSRGGECNIICTQPRRISAIGVAERVAAERCETIGQSVGYSIRLENVRSEETQIMFVTTGILLRRLQEDPLLLKVSHLIVDEVHERDLNSDFLMIILKQLLQRRNYLKFVKPLKLILMSATLNAATFASYFSNCPVIEIPGRTFPVEQFFLEDAIEQTGYKMDIRSPYAQSSRKFQQYDGYSINTCNVMAILNRKKINYELITKLVEEIIQSPKFSQVEGGILIFLPGMHEISTMIEFLQTLSISKKLTILPLHSTLSSEQQQRIFKKAPAGTRKIVVSTNIAETSVTVDDIVFVIDACKVKETRYDGKLEALVEDFTSKASIRQRMGRAGRVSAGFCWSLVAKAKYVHLKEFQDPEMLRVPLDSLVLQILLLKLGHPRTFLQQALDPPPADLVNSSIRLLQEMNALDQNENITPLGMHLGKLPVAPKIGKLLIYGAIFKCLSPILTICAALSDKSPFISSFENREDAEDAKRSWDSNNDLYSDHLTIVKAYNAWEKFIKSSNSSDFVFCRDNYLSKSALQNMKDLRHQYKSILKDCGFVTSKKHKKTDQCDADTAGLNAKAELSEVDSNSYSDAIVKAVLSAGLLPNIAQAKPTYDSSGNVLSTQYFVKDGTEVFIHPTSVLSDLTKLPAQFLVFHDRVLTTRDYLRDCTTIGSYSVILFGSDLQAYPEDQSIEIDGWINFHTSGKEAILFLKLRQQLDKLFLAKSIDPRIDISNHKLTMLITSLLEGETEFVR